MKVVYDLEDFRTHDKPVVLAIGFFDGVHIGHRAVIEEAITQARKRNGEAWILTFTPHPLRIINPDAAPPLLTSTPHKLLLFAGHHVDGTLVMEFTPELRTKEPREFLDLLRSNISGLQHIVVGENWTFGHGHKGSANQLDELAKDLGITSSRVPPVLRNAQTISSTRIRETVTRGELDEAAHMLGRYFSIWGNVVHGDKVGRTLGYPTANVDPHNEVHPPNGIYATMAVLAGKRYPAAAYIGYRPTIRAKGGPWVVEAYLLDTSVDLYESEIEVLFIQKIREDRKFESREALTRQISQDVSDARRILSESLNG